MTGRGAQNNCYVKSGDKYKIEEVLEEPDACVFRVTVQIQHKCANLQKGGHEPVT